MCVWHPFWKLAFSCHLHPCSVSGGLGQHRGNPENAGKGLLAQISSDLLKPLSLRVPLAAIQPKSFFVGGKVRVGAPWCFRCLSLALTQTSSWGRTIRACPLLRPHLLAQKEVHLLLALPCPHSHAPPAALSQTPPSPLAFGRLELQPWLLNCNGLEGRNPHKQR